MNCYIPDTPLLSLFEFDTTCVSIEDETFLLLTTNTVKKFLKLL